MSRRISLDPKILPIIFDSWPPIVTIAGPTTSRREAALSSRRKIYAFDARRVIEL